jgi:outer membrane protein TolC
VAIETTALGVNEDVRRQYFDVLRQFDLLEVEVASLEGLLRDQEATEQRFRYAQATRIDVLRAELAVEEQNRAIRQQRRALDQARLNLWTTLGDPDLQPFRVVTQTLPLFDPMGLDAERLVERAIDAHPDVRQAQVGLEEARLGVSEAKQSRWPRLNVSYRLGRQTFTGDTGALFDVSHEATDLYNNFSIGLSLPYFSNYFSNRQSEVQAEVAVRNQQETVRETRLQVEQQVRAQLIALRNQYETLAANRRTLEIAEEALRLAREQYRLGTVSFSELQDQVDAARDARRESITASYGFHDTLLDLEAAVGGPVTADTPVTDGAADGLAPGPVDPR